MENRVNRFYELHNNKWFHIMNLTLDIIKINDKKERYMLSKYGCIFYYNMVFDGNKKLN
jgi:hypothetical protein